MDVRTLPLKDALRITPTVFHDERGYFKETYARERYRRAGVPAEFVQDNVSFSHERVLRGMHGSAKMAKLVTVLQGEVFDVIVDLRSESPTYKRWHGERLLAEEHTQLYVPPGFLHGFLVLSDGAIFAYKQSVAYDPASEIAVRWNDPDLAIDWPLPGHEPILSDKDAGNPRLDDALAKLSFR